MKKRTLLDFNKMKKNGEPITWITSYDYCLATAAERAEVDMILVGDSGGMVQLGHETTNPVTMDEMIILSQSARRGAPNTFLVGDMPQGSYEVSNEDAVRNALRFVKEAKCDAIKLEGGRRIVDRIKAISDAGILAFGHLGLTPQSASSFGGYRVQCKSAKSFEETIDDALALQHAGAIGILLEAMPAAPAGQVARKLDIPILGIGAGNQVDGQLIIIHDMLGLYPSFRPKFAKCFIPDIIGEFSLKLKTDSTADDNKSYKDGFLALAQLAVERYIKDTKTRAYPNDDYTYSISTAELDEVKKSSYWVND